MSVLDERALLPAATRVLYTAEDLEQLPSDARYELIRGELCAMPNNSADHGNKTMRISTSVAQFVDENDLGECFAAETRFTIESNPDTTLGPDFAYISKERLTEIPLKGYLRLAPDLVVETRSPNDTRTEFALKISRWLQAGVREVWALDPATRTLVVHRTGTVSQTLTIDDTLTGGEVLPGYSVTLRRIFRDVHST